MASYGKQLWLWKTASTQRLFDVDNTGEVRPDNSFIKNTRD